MNEIRRAAASTSSPGASLENISDGEITDVEIESHTVEPIEEDLPYESQNIIDGEFVFHKSHPFREDGTEHQISFSYREDSGLFFLEPENRDNLIPEIIRAIRRELPNDIKILTGLNQSRESLWEFVNSADEIIEIIIDREGEQETLFELRQANPDINIDQLIDEKLVKFEVVYRNSGRSIIVVYENDSLSIDYQNPIDKEYILQKFEKHSIYNIDS